MKMYVYILMQGLDAAAKGYMQEAMSEEGVFLLILRWCYCVGSWDLFFGSFFSWREEREDSSYMRRNRYQKSTSHL